MVALVEYIPKKAACLVVKNDGHFPAISKMDEELPAKSYTFNVPEKVFRRKDDDFYAKIFKNKKKTKGKTGI